MSAWHFVRGCCICHLYRLEDFNIFGDVIILRYEIMDAVDILNKHVAFYEFLGHKECSRRTLFSILNDIRKGVHADAVLKLRKNVDNVQLYRNQKKRLPSVCFCGIFWGSHYKYDVNLYTNLLVIDIDYIKNDRLEIKRLLMNDPKIVAVWDSVSGQGLKALLYINYLSAVLPENIWVVHEMCAFPQVQKYLKESYGINIDPSGKDVTRYCFMSYDPDIFLRKEFDVFDVTVDLSEVSICKIKKRYLNRKYYKIGL